MFANQATIQQGLGTAFESSDVGIRRGLTQSPAAIRAALRRVVHDHVSGWGIVLSQTPRERRRKKRLWDHRTSERFAFQRPVWVHEAHWSESDPQQARQLLVQRSDEMFLVRDISDTGIGLTSDRAPKRRLVVLEFDSWQGKPIEIVVYLHWRRKAGRQDYHCGGSILGVLATESAVSSPAVD